MSIFRQSTEADVAVIEAELCYFRALFRPVAARILSVADHGSPHSSLQHLQRNKSTFATLQDVTSHKCITPCNYVTHTKAKVTRSQIKIIAFTVICIFIACLALIICVLRVF